MHCPNCAFDNPPGTLYCGRCGTALTAAETPPAQPQTPPPAYAPPPSYAPPPGPTCLLVCVSGPDLGRQIVVGGQPLTLGTSPECGAVSADPTAAPEAAEFAFSNGYFYFRTRSGEPLQLGNAPASDGVLPPGAPLRVGSSWWQTAPPAGPYASYAYAPPRPGQVRPNRDWFQSLNHRVGAVTGAGPVEGLQVGELLSEVFHKHNDEDVEEYFMTGTRTTTPPLLSLEAVWPKPWVFFRIFAVSLLLFFAFSFSVQQFQNPNLLPGLLITGSFAIPLTVVVFYFEMNIPHNVSFYQVFKAILVGGIFSLIITLFGDMVIRLELPGVIEELGKALVLLLFVGNPKYRWTLNGLLLGGAIGAGFAGFESSGYALRALLGGGHLDLDTAQQSIILRGVLSPGGHVAWAALEGAALWKIKGDKPFVWSMVQDSRFLHVLGLAMVLHTVWDIQIFLPFIPTLLMYPLLAVLSLIAWVAILGFIQDGLKQVQTAQSEAQAQEEQAQEKQVQSAIPLDPTPNLP